MAEGLLRHLGGDDVEVFSAGTHPTAVRAEAVTVMGEIGIDISSHRSKSVDEYRNESFDAVITVCNRASETCPVFPGAYTRVAWDFNDPAAVEGDESTRLDAFRSARDEIRAHLVAWLGEGN